MVFGSWDSGFCPWASGDQHCLATKCVCIANSIHYRIGSRDLVLASGHLGSKHCSALKCTHGSDSNAYAVFSGQPSAAHFGHRFLVLGLDQVRTARLSRGSQITIRHPGDHTMLSYPTTYAVGLCTWFNSGVDQVCTARPSCGVQIATRHPV